MRRGTACQAGASATPPAVQLGSVCLLCLDSHLTDVNVSKITSHIHQGLKNWVGFSLPLRENGGLRHAESALAALAEHSLKAGPAGF